MDKQTEGREDLYSYKSSRASTYIPANRDRLHLQDQAPPGYWRRSRLFGTGGRGPGTNMRAEDLKRWLDRMEAEEDAERDGEESLTGAGDTWRMLVRLV